MSSLAKNISVLIVWCLFVAAPAFSTPVGQDSVVLAPQVATPPVVDGRGDDACWEKAKWQNIDQIWIPYGAKPVDSADYHGRYKLVWSSATNLLYFLIEVTDDVFVDGYVAGKTADIYNYDISEVFIDENKSGGPHIYDGPGLNAQNAFTYHMYAAFPSAGGVTTTCRVEDLGGTQSTLHSVDYTSHIPQFAMRTEGRTAVREFSLIVYNDTYKDNAKEASRVTLTTGKVMGLSVAYCDNDGASENPKVRDNMFGSVWEPSPGNLHWQNADYFGTVKLTGDGSTGIRHGTEASASATATTLYPNPASTHAVVHLSNSYHGEVTIRLYNMLGQQVYHATSSKQDLVFDHTISINHLPAGTYLVQTQLGSSIVYQKLLLAF
ncbi:MAG TPA: sugar-binding protein [Bacteroidota bacterium]|nr:sugar-binding protein [Bacteroidota bacterium]